MQNATREELEALMRFAKTLNHEISLEEMLQGALSHLTQFFGLETGWIWLTRDDGQTFELVATRNLPEPLAQDLSWSQGGCTCQGEFRCDSFQTAVLSCSRLESLNLKKESLKFHISVPLRTATGRLGVLNLVSRIWKNLTPRELETVGIAGEILAIAIERNLAVAAQTKQIALEERVHVARELHDTVVQELVALTMKLETLDALMDEQTPYKNIVVSSLNTARQSLQDARTAVLELRDEPTEAKTLHDALEDLITRKFMGRSEEVTLQCHDDVMQTITARQRHCIYRVVQEALSNVIRHAQASDVKVLLALKDEHVHITIEDDGKGVTQIAEGIGLRGMRERVLLFQGELMVQPAQEQRGSRIIALLPIET